MTPKIPALALLFLTTPAFAQTPTSHPQTEQQILEELRAIHHDLRASTTLQLLLAELQIAQSTLDHALQRRDALKATRSQLQSDETAAQAEVDRFESGLNKTANPAQEFVDRLAELKANALKIKTQALTASEQLDDADGRLRTAQAEKDDIQSQLSTAVQHLGTTP